MNDIGLSSNVVWQIKHIIKEFPEIESFWVFGSRALGNYRKNSDIDIAIEGKNISFDTLSHLKGRLEEEVSTACFFDVVHYNNNLEEELQKHIRIFGKVLV